MFCLNLCCGSRFVLDFQLLDMICHGSLHRHHVVCHDPKEIASSGPELPGDKDMVAG